MTHEKWMITLSELSLYLFFPAHTCFLPEPEPADLDLHEIPILLPSGKLVIVSLYRVQED